MIFLYCFNFGIWIIIFVDLFGDDLSEFSDIELSEGELEEVDNILNLEASSSSSAPPTRGTVLTDGNTKSVGVYECKSALEHQADKKHRGRSRKGINLSIFNTKLVFSFFGIVF